MDGFAGAFTRAFWSGFRPGFGSLNQHLRGDPILDAFEANGDAPTFLAHFGNTATSNQGFYVDGSKTTFASAFNFSRSGAAIYVDKTGTLQTASANEARTNHHLYINGAWRRRALFEPEAATNLISYSNAFGDSSDSQWSGGGSTTVSTTEISPDGTANASEVRSNTTGSILKGFFLGSGNLTTFSVYAKKGTSDGINVRIFNADTSSFIAVGGYDFSTAAATNDTTVEMLDDGWIRLSVTGVCPSGANCEARLRYNTSGTDLSTITYGAQLEENPYPTSYIPTAGSTVTRAADTLTIPAANNAYSADGVTIAMRGEMTYADTGIADEVEFLEWEADANNRIALSLDTAGSDTGKPTFSQSDSGTTDTVTGAAGAYSPGVHVPFAIASRHSPDDINGAVDGTALTVDTSVTVLADLSATDIEIATTGGPMLIDSIAIWSSPGTDARLEDASEVITYD